MLETLAGALIIAVMLIFLAQSYGNSITMMQKTTDLHGAVNAAMDENLRQGFAVSKNDGEFTTTTVAKNGKIILTLVGK